jgi:hypothetical protein
VYIHVTRNAFLLLVNLKDCVSIIANWLVLCVVGRNRVCDDCHYKALRTCVSMCHKEIVEWGRAQAHCIAVFKPIINWSEGGVKRK